MKIKLSWSILAPVFLFGLVLAVYVLTLAPSVNLGDSSALIAAAAKLVIPYPPGYPLFVVLGHLFTKIPYQSIPWRVNFMSAIFGSLTVVFVYLGLVKMEVRKGAALAGSLFLAFTTTFWYYNLTTEVFSLNNFFLAFLVFLLISWSKGGGEKYLNLFAFCFGLGLTNHQTLIFALPGLVILIIAGQKRFKLVPKLFLFFLGLSPYLILPFLAARNFSFGWGNPTDLGSLLGMIARKHFGTFQLTDLPGGSRLNSFKAYFFFFTQNWGLVGLFLIGLGLLALWEKRKWFWFLVILFLFVGPVFTFLLKMPFYAEIRQPVLERFFLLSSVVLAFLVGWGFDFLLGIRKKTFLGMPLLVLILGLAFSPLVKNFSLVDQKNNLVYYSYGLNLLKTLPENSFFISSGDVTAGIMTYLQAVEKKRPDVCLLGYSLLTEDWYYRQVLERCSGFPLPQKEALGAEDLKTLCRLENPVYIFPLYETQRPVLEGCSFLQRGMAIELFSQDRLVDPEEVVQTNLDFWSSYLGQEDLFWSREKTAEERKVLYFYAAARAGLAEIYLQNGQAEKGKEELRRARFISRDFTPATNVLAMILAQEDRVEEAIQMEEEAIRLSPEDFIAYRNLGMFIAGRDKNRAVDLLRTYLKLRPNAEDGDQIWGMIRELTGEKETDKIEENGGDSGQNQPSV